MPMPQHHLQSASDLLVAIAADSRIGAIAAAGAITSPFWLAELQRASELAGVLAPILGCAWLVVQIVFKIVEGWRASRK